MLGFIVGAFFPAISKVRKWKPDIIHVHFAVPTGVLARIISKISGVPYLLTAHLGDVPGGVPEKTDRWFRLIYPFTHAIWKDADRVVAVSDFTRDLALKHYDVPIEVIPNGVRLPNERLHHERVRPEEVRVGTPPRIIFAGRFQPQKNLTSLVQTLGKVRDLEWECKLIGDGPEKLIIEETIAEHELGDRIDLPGWVHTNVVWRELGQSDILAMPSLSEGLPVVGVHALGQGLAIVANKAGGLTDLVEDGVNGRLCEIGDEQCFEEALKWCLEDHRRLKQLKKSSLEKARNFDIENVADAYEELFLDSVS
jgi:glycosyltransferase involved in cell wall biosynthesis